MQNSILEAVKLGLWDFEPHSVDVAEFEASDETPGTREKLDVLASHVRQGMRDWYSDGRLNLERAPANIRRKPR